MFDTVYFINEINEEQIVTPLTLAIKEVAVPRPNTATGYNWNGVECVKHQ